MDSLTADNYRLLKYLKLTGAYQRIPVINIAPISEDADRLTTFCFNISDFFLQDLREDQFSSLVKDILVSEKKDSKDYHGVRTAYSSGKLLSTEEIKWMEDMEGLVSLHLSDSSYNTEKLAFDLHLSRSSLTRKVRYLYGINPGEYITRIRMDKALYYLQNRQYVSIAQVSSALGFRHAGSFTRCFHNHFGVPPSDIVR
jgi:AraC-like DNA-binding protein